MEWLILAISALFLFAVIGVIEGVSIKKYFKSGKTYLFYTTFLQGILSCLIFLFKPLTFQGLSFFLISIAAGFFFVYSLMPYMKSLEFEEISRINPLFSLGPVFVLLLSILLLNFQLSNTHYLGFAFLLLGGFLISLKRFKGVIKISRGFWYMMLTNLLLGFYFIITDYLFKRYDYWSCFFFIQLGILLASLSLLLFKNYGQAGMVKIGKMSSVALILVVAASILSIIAVAIRNLAISFNSATIVTSLGGIQSLFVLIITSLLTFKFSRILKEEITREVVLLKIASIILLIIGIYLVTV